MGTHGGIDLEVHAVRLAGSLVPLEERVQGPTSGGWLDWNTQSATQLVAGVFLADGQVHQQDHNPSR